MRNLFRGVSGIKNFKHGHSQNWSLYRHQAYARGTVDRIKIAQILTMEIRGIGIIQGDPGVEKKLKREIGNGGTKE